MLLTTSLSTFRDLNVVVRQVKSCCRPSKVGTRCFPQAEKPSSTCVSYRRQPHVRKASCFFYLFAFCGLFVGRLQVFIHCSDEGLKAELEGLLGDETLKRKPELSNGVDDLRFVLMVSKVIECTGLAGSGASELRE